MEKTLKEIIRILEHAGDVKAYALIGGLAVGGWIAPRARVDKRLGRLMEKLGLT